MTDVAERTDEKVNGDAAAMLRQRAEAEMYAKTGVILTAMVTGIMASFPGAPPSLIMPAIAKRMGVLLATSVRGDLQSLLKHRKALLEAFKAGIAEVDIGKQQDLSVPDRRPMPR